MADLPLYSVNQGRDGIQKIAPNTRMCVYVCVSLSGRICVFSLDSTDFNLEIFGFFSLRNKRGHPLGEGMFRRQHISCSRFGRSRRRFQWQMSDY